MRLALTSLDVHVGHPPALSKSLPAPLLMAAVLPQPQALLPTPLGVLGHGCHHSYENAFIKVRKKKATICIPAASVDR